MARKLAKPVEQRLHTRTADVLKVPIGASRPNAARRLCVRSRTLAQEEHRTHRKTLLDHCCERGTLYAAAARDSKYKTRKVLAALRACGLSWEEVNRMTRGEVRDFLKVANQTPECKAEYDLFRRIRRERKETEGRLP